ncbi:MAG: hypothetical protein ACTSQE_17400, partial [Candidatus Heimdallarchaeaceae archaeon]
MRNCQKSSIRSNKNIIERIDEVLVSYTECQKYRRTDVEKERIMMMTSSVSSTLDSVLQVLKLVLWKYELLTSIYKTKSKQTTNNILDDLDYLLSTLIRDHTRIDAFDQSILNKIIKKSSNIIREMQVIDRAITSELDSVKDKILQDVRITEQILKIPDIAESVKDTKALDNCINNIKKFLDNSRTEDDISRLKD